jgi:hypothetical protein
MHTRWAPLIAVLLLLLASACSSGDDDAAAPTTSAPPDTTAPTPTTLAPTSTTAPTTTTTVVDEETAVIAAYLASWDTFLLVTNPGQPDHPDIDRFTTGDAAEQLRQTAADRLAANEATQLPEPTQQRHDVTVVRIEGDVALVRDCNIDDSFRVNLASGTRSNDDVATFLWSARMVKGSDGAWRVANLEVLQDWPGATSCEQ